MMKNNTQNTQKGIVSIEQEIASIFNSLSATSSKGAEVKMEKLGRYASCKGMVSVKDKSSSANIIVKYAFYPSVYNPNRIGSVAIYADDTFSIYSKLRMERRLFGRSIRSISIESGFRPFIDVKLVEQPV